MDLNTEIILLAAKRLKKDNKSLTLTDINKFYMENKQEVDTICHNIKIVRREIILSSIHKHIDGISELLHSLEDI